jgi:hypothetical protein
MFTRPRHDTWYQGKISIWEIHFPERGQWMKETTTAQLSFPALRHWKKVMKPVGIIFDIHNIVSNL